MIRHLPEREYRRVRWKNGLGWTTEVALDPPQGEWDWRASIATVDADSEFSRFPGVDRSLLVLEGAGMVLDVEGQGSVTLIADGPPLAFSGDVTTSSRLVSGPTRDFNVMTRRGVFAHAMVRHALVGSHVLTREPARTWLIHLIHGDMTVEDLPLAPGDSALVDDRDHAELRGTGAIVLVELRRL